MKKNKTEIAPNPNCKDCFGKGKILRTSPIPNANKNYIKKKNLPPKEMVRIGTPCHCLKQRKIKED
jgi:hypothetical protein|tara:strand:- start:639 stop:836 length:198 start_codon:yes stop_codon:yes gene_type:complete